MNKWTWLCSNKASPCIQVYKEMGEVCPESHTLASSSQEGFWSCLTWTQRWLKVYLLHVFSGRLFSSKQSFQLTQGILAFWNHFIMSSLRNSRLFSTGGGNIYLVCIRDTAWSEDSSIYEWTVNKSTCSNGPWASKWEAEGTGNILPEMELSGPPGEKHSDSWNHEGWAPDLW